MILLRRFTVLTESQEELDFVCQNVSPEIEYFEVRLLKGTRTQAYTRFPDICRLRKLQSLTIKGQGRDDLFNYLRFLDQNQLPSVRKLTVIQLVEESPQTMEFISKINSVFPNFKRFERDKKGLLTFDFW